MTSRYIEISEVQSQLGGISRKTLIRKLRRGVIPGGELLYRLEAKGGARANHKPGERWVVVREVFERWMKAREVVKKAG